MMIRRLRGLLGAAACALAATVAFTGSSAFARPTALGTAFTYQGQLKQGGSAYSGTAEFRFRLYDALTAGNQIGLQIALTGGNAPMVSNGLFKVSLDFGLDGNGFPAFSGEARWLEIDVRTTGAGAFTTLSPRQAITATPYALAAQHALTTPGISADASGNVGIGTTTPANSLHVLKGGSSGFAAHSLSPLILEGNTHTFMSINTPVNSEAGILFRNPAATSFGGGIIFDAASTPKGIQFRTGGNNPNVVINQYGRVGIGTTNPGAIPLYVLSGDQASIVGQNNFSGGSGMLGQASGTSGKGVYGYADSTTGLNYGVYGQCNNPAGFDFYAGGAGVNYGAPSSIRWKRNVETVADPLGVLDQMRGVYFDWDAEHGGQHDIGFIGEEVGKVLPEVVAYEQDSEFVTGMDYGKLTPLLVEAIKALRAENDAQIEQQQEQIIALQQDNQELRHRLAAIEATIAQIADRHSK